jgi:hypothetical protein
MKKLQLSIEEKFNKSIHRILNKYYRDATSRNVRMALARKKKKM